MTLVKRNHQNYPSFNSLLGDFFNDSFLNWPANNWDRKWGNTPALNMSENDDQWTIELAVPGMNKGDFKIDLDEDTLTISAEQKDEKSNENEGYKVREFNYSGFKRSFRLPENKVEKEAIKANYENGVLKLELPKKEDAKPQPKRMIEIS